MKKTAVWPFFSYIFFFSFYRVAVQCNDCYNDNANNQIPYELADFGYNPVDSEEVHAVSEEVHYKNTDAALHNSADTSGK